MIYPNEDELWVIRIVLNEAIDSRDGLAAYMNVFLRTNPVIMKYKLTKVCIAYPQACSWYILEDKTRVM